MFYSILADLVVGLHVAYVSFVVIGQLLILLGIALRWNWIRNPWFRIAHLLAMVIVAFEAVLAIDCPLTVWEGALRRLAGQDIGQGSFLGRLLHNLIFYDFETWVFTVAYIAFAVLVIATFVLAPPRFQQRGRQGPR
jgi:uncharacterized protein DUF2784